MSIRINDIAPDFVAESTAGTIRFHEWLGGSYAIIFSHPRDFTPVCTTEFAAVAQLAARIREAQHQGDRRLGGLARRTTASGSATSRPSPVHRRISRSSTTRR